MTDLDRRAFGEPWPSRTAATVRIVGGADAAAPTPARAELVRLSDVQPQPVEWLWSHRLALGKLTIFAGDPGLGKSFLSLDIAARLSRGRPWPDAPGIAQADGSVILLSAEDDPADTIRPRLDAAGADVSRIHVLTTVRQPDGKLAMFNLERDLPALGDALDTVRDCRLVVVDPVSAFMGATDSHKNADVRGLLAPLSELAMNRRVAVVAVTHLRKGEGAAIYRAIGSVAFTAAARAVWAVAKDKDAPPRRLMLPVKNNLAVDGTGLAYRIIDGALSWEPDPILMTADEALAVARPTGRGRAVPDAAEWLREQLDGEPLPKGEIEARAATAGISFAAIRRAKDVLGVRAAKAGFGDGSRWFWGLPDEGAHAAELPKMLNCAPSDETPDFIDDSAKVCKCAPSWAAEHLPGGNGDGNGVPAGWTPAAWRDHLRHIADRCEGEHPDRAAELRREAAGIRT